MQIDIPDVKAEVEAAFAAYEQALVTNDVPTLEALFWDDFATASTLFSRETTPGKIGRQQQSWARLPEGWRVVAAHVSLIDE
jgi:hypothetical protein